MVRYGLLLPTRGAVIYSDDPAEMAEHTQRDVVEFAITAEDHGVDSLWVGDSVLARPRLDPLTTLAAVAARTDSVALGTAVYLPGLRNPITVAHQTATVDQISGGRFSLGVGVGSGPKARAEYETLSIPFDERGSLLDEALDIVTRLWEGPVDHEGRHFSFEGADIGVQPVGSPTVYVASGGFDPDRGFPTPICNRLLTHGDGWLPVGVDPPTYEAGLGQLRERLADAGRDPAAVDPAVYLDVALADSHDAALEKAREFLTAYSYTDHPKWSDLTDGLIEQRGAFGPAETVRAQLKAYEDAGVETIVVRFAASNQQEQFRRFADVL